MHVRWCEIPLQAGSICGNLARSHSCHQPQAPDFEAIHCERGLRSHWMLHDNGSSTSALSCTLSGLAAGSLDWLLVLRALATLMLEVVPASDKAAYGRILMTTLPSEPTPLRDIFIKAAHRAPRSYTRRSSIPPAVYTTPTLPYRLHSCVSRRNCRSFAHTRPPWKRR